MKKPHQKPYRILAGIASLFLACASLQAQVLMIDFGETTATNTTNSPYHAATGATTGGYWNNVLKTDITTGGLYWANSSSGNMVVATGVSLKLGANTAAGQTTIDLSKDQFVDVEGTKVKNDIYNGTAAQDAIRLSVSSGARAIGLQVGGLAYGVYDIYITARNTNLTTDHTQNIYLGTSTTAGNFNYANYGDTAQSLTYANFTSDTATASKAWGAGENYVVFRVTINEENQYLNIATIGGTSGEQRGFLNSLQIVAVPEPSTVALIAGLGVLALCFIHRRCRR